MEIALQLTFNDESFFQFIRQKNIIKIFYGGELLTKVNLDKTIEVKNAIINLRNINISENWLSKTFGLARSTINNWYNIYNSQGIDALISYRKGPHKITEEIKAFIIAKFKELKCERNYKKTICEDIEKNYKLTIHWRSVARILKANGINLSKNKYNKKNEETDEIKKSDEIICENAGLFLIYPFFSRLEIENLFINCKNFFQKKYYSVLNYIYGLFLLFASNMIEVEENIKMYNDKKISLILGTKGLPSLRSYRKYIPQIIKSVNMEDFQYKLSQAYYKKHTECNELYIDGHFMPYNGKFNTFKGYNPIRRFAQKGRTGYFINSAEGRPFFYILSDGYKDFREYLMKIFKGIKKITHKRNKNDLLLIFDRGGWGKEFCNELTKNINFICWRTGKESSPKNSKWIKINLLVKTNNYSEYNTIVIEATEKIIHENKKVKRYIFIKKNKKISLAYSNDNSRTLEELVIALTKRWGVQENIFKPLKKIGIDKITSYKVEKYPDDWILEEGIYREVKNPKIIILKDKIKKFKNEIKDLKRRIGNLINKGINLKNVKILKLKIRKTENNIRKLKFELENTPERVEIEEIIKADNIVRLNSDKKQFVDMIKILSYNVQQDIVDVIRPLYGNERDVNMFVRELLRITGTIILSEEQIIVKYSKFRSKRKTYVLEYLLSKINELNIVHPILEKKMHFICR